MKEAMFYEKLSDGAVSCGICRFGCRIAPGERGRCCTRENRGGTLYTLAYRRVVAEQVDPVEKKPLFHVLPGTSCYSIATLGCNFRCLHCQNHELAQSDCSMIAESGYDLAPEEVVARALAAGCSSVAYTYTEATVYFEYAYETAVLAKAAGLQNILVTNGYIAAAPLEALAPYLDAVNIDLKGFTEHFYRETVQASLQQVLDCIRHFKRLGVWTEITTVVIPGLNDGDEELTALASFIANELGTATPWHVTRFAPYHKLRHLPPASTARVREVAEIGRRAGLGHVYQVDSGASFRDSHCTVCNAVLIERDGYDTERNLLDNGLCPDCSSPYAGVWSCRTSAAA